MWGGSMYGAITWAGINVYGVCYGDNDGTQFAAWVCGDDSAAVVCGDTSADGFTTGGRTARGRTRGSSASGGRVTGGSSKREGC